MVREVARRLLDHEAAASRVGRGRTADSACDVRRGKREAHRHILLSPVGRCALKERALRFAPRSSELVWRTLAEL